jgi:hypothetical protein
LEAIAYPSFQGVLRVDWDKLQSSSEWLVNASVSATATGIGVYFFYKEGENSDHHSNSISRPRIVRIETHKENNFRSRVSEHFLLNEPKMKEKKLCYFSIIYFSEFRYLLDILCWTVSRL